MRQPGNVKQRSFDSPLFGVASQYEVNKLVAYAIENWHKMPLAMTQGDPVRAGALVRYYDRLCRLVGLDTVLVVCQTWHETGTWSSAWFQEPRRNPAGIAVSGVRSYLPLPGYQYMPSKTTKKSYMRGHAYKSYAVAAQSHVWGLAMWAGLDETKLRTVVLDKDVSKLYKPPKAAIGSAKTVGHLGQAYNPNKIGWAYPGHDDKLSADAAYAAGKTYGHAIARLANKVIGL